MPEKSKKKKMKEAITPDDVLVLQAKSGANSVIVIEFGDDSVKAQGCGGTGGMADAVNAWTEKMIDSIAKGGLTFPTPNGLVSLPLMLAEREAAVQAKTDAKSAEAKASEEAAAKEAAEAEKAVAAEAAAKTKADSIAAKEKAEAEG